MLNCWAYYSVVVIYSRLRIVTLLKGPNPCTRGSWTKVPEPAPSHRSAGTIGSREAARTRGEDIKKAGTLGANKGQRHLVVDREIVYPAPARLMTARLFEPALLPWSESRSCGARLFGSSMGIDRPCADPCPARLLSRLFSSLNNM